NIAVSLRSGGQFVGMEAGLVDGPPVVGEVHRGLSRLPAAIDPLLKVRTFLADRGVITVAGHDDRVARQGRKEPLVDGPDDGREISPLELGRSRSSRKQW